MKIDKNNITAVILAGGKGRRLEGQDKGLVIYKDKPLIQHVIERIQSQVGDIVINANRNQETYASYGYSTISDEMSDFQGPLAGFASAMKAVKTDYILTLPCDGPSLPLDLVSRMLSKLNTFSDVSNCIVVAHDGEWLQPVHALIPVTLVDSLEKFLANGDRKIDLWYAKHELVVVDFSDQPDAFFNINKKEQLGESDNK
jgi:molybdenum cofactor guanylyltransferase